MKKLILAFACLFILGTTGCQVTKQWVVETAKDIAIQAVDSQIDMINQKYLEPRIAELEKKLGQKIDQNNDGIFGSDELKSAISLQMQGVVKNVVEVVKNDTNQQINNKITESLKGVATADQIKMIVDTVVKTTQEQSDQKLDTRLQEKLKGVATASQIKDITDNVEGILAEKDKDLADRLKNVATKDDGVKNIIALIILYILSKLGIKVGPKGLAGLRTYMQKKPEQTTPNL